METGRISEGPLSAGGRLSSSAKFRNPARICRDFHSRSGGVAPPLSASFIYDFSLKFQCCMTLFPVGKISAFPSPLWGGIGVGVERHFRQRRRLRPTSRPPTLPSPTKGEGKMPLDFAISA